MALKGSESWDLYGDSDITDYFVSVGLGTIVAGAGRCGSAAFKGTAAIGSGPTAGVTTSSDSGFAGWATSPTGFGVTTNFSINSPLNSFPLAFIRVLADGSVDLWKGVNGSIGTRIGTTPAGLISISHYTHVGVEWKISTSGYLRVYINGHLAADSGTINMFTPFTSGGWSSLSWTPIGFIDDLYWGDGDTSDPLNPWASFLGDLRVEGQLCLTDAVGGGGTFRTWTPSTGTDHGALLDENPPDDDTTFVSSGTIGQRESVKFANITPTTGAVYGIKAMPNMVKTTFADRTVQVGAYVAATEAYQPAQALAQTTYKYYPAMMGYNPVAAVPWTISTANSMEPIVKIAS
jgi:hypothetical protein